MQEVFVWICCCLFLGSVLVVSSTYFCLLIVVCIICALFVMAVVLYTMLWSLVIFQCKCWKIALPCNMSVWDGSGSQTLAHCARAVSCTPEFSSDLEGHVALHMLNLDIAIAYISLVSVTRIVKSLYGYINGHLDLKQTHKGPLDGKHKVNIMLNPAIQFSCNARGNNHVGRKLNDRHGSSCFLKICKDTGK